MNKNQQFSSEISQEIYKSMKNWSQLLKFGKEPNAILQARVGIIPLPDMKNKSPHSSLRYHKTHSNLGKKCHNYSNMAHSQILFYCISSPWYLIMVRIMVRNSIQPSWRKVSGWLDWQTDGLDPFLYSSTHPPPTPNPTP